MMNNPKEGDLYKIIRIGDQDFEIRYGYYPEDKPHGWAPVPIYPDFVTKPVYNHDGRRFVTADGDVCEHYHPKPIVSGENWCDDCSYFYLQEDLIGICQCDEKDIVRISEKNQ